MAATSLVALRDRREQVIAQLTDAFGRDDFDVEELERRLDRAHAARSLAELDPLVADLPPPEATTALVPSTAVAVERPERVSKKRMVAVFGELVRNGRWIVPKKMTLTTVFGDGELDFREAEFGHGVTDLHITCVLGEARVIVPPWLAVESDANVVLGSHKGVQRAHDESDPDRPLLRVSCTIVLGEVTVMTRLPGETRRQAKKREKEEAKALRGERRALPPGSGRK